MEKRTSIFGITWNHESRGTFPKAGACGSGGGEEPQTLTFLACGGGGGGGGSCGGCKGGRE